MKSNDLAWKAEVDRELDHTLFHQFLKFAVSPVNTERGTKPKIPSFQASIITDFIIRRSVF